MIWKGDYLNLGTGAELGIYRELDIIGIDTHHWLVDNNLAMPMKIELYEDGNKIIDYDSSKDQENKNGEVWWVTGFNSYLQDRKASDLDAVYMIDFSSSKELFDAFKKAISYERDENRWTFTEDYIAVFRW